MIKKLAKSIGEYKKDTLLTPLFVMIEVLLEVMIPFTMAKLIDNGINKGDLAYAVKIGGIMLAMAFVALIFGALSGKTCATAGVGFAKNLRREMFYNIQNFSFSNVDKFSSSSLITRLTTDVNNVQQSFQMIIRILVRAPLMLICATILAVRINKSLAWTFFCLLPILAVVLLIIIFKSYPIFKQMFKKYDKLNQTVQENLTGIRTVKSYVREEHEVNKFLNSSDDLMEYSKKAEKIIVVAMPFIMFIIYTAMISVSWFGGKMIIAGNMTEGNFMSFLGYVIQIFMSFIMVGMVATMIILSKASAERIVEVFDEKSDIVNCENPVTEFSDSTIAFKDVYFSYTNDCSNCVLNDINLTVKSGETVGIIGGTGSAKSSLVQLIPRLYDVTKGQITVGGVDVKDYDIETLRNNIAMVLQKNLLFSGTIKDNLLWGDKNATEEDIIKATKNASAHGFIESFQSDYNTELGQAGVNVSGGQKQRLCIARALLKNPKILILDDSTSAVDVKTNADIMNSLKKDYPDTTKIIIAQRVASIIDADKIVVLHEGRIDAIGSHSELIDKNEIYSEVYYTQMRGAEI